ncbi:MAG: GMC oxidoreductase [Planctomycetia bacterium]|nr:GMC oxidoreductase [Planctomycetia bacterium]
MPYRVDDYSRGGMAYAQRVIKKIFSTIGASEDSWEFTDLNSLDRFYSGSAHIMETCRTGDDPKTSVVDANCRAHDHSNLCGDQSAGLRDRHCRCLDFSHAASPR